MIKEIRFKEIREYIFIYHPFDNSFPIVSVSVTILAESRKEAELINLNNNYKFFDQSCSVQVKEGLIGY